MADQVQSITPRMQALQNLSAQLPVANSRVAQGQSAARALQLQQAVGAAPATTAITPASQQMGATMATQAGGQAVEQASNSVRAQGQIGQQGIQEQQLQSQSTLGGLQAGARAQQMSNVQRLANVSQKAKQELYDDQMRFQRDEQGRTQFNTRQLADYARVQAQSQQQLANYQQQSDQLYKRSIQAMEQAQVIVSEDLRQRAAVASQQGDQTTQREIAQMREDMDSKIAKEKAAAANNSAMWGAGGTIAGAAAGAYFGDGDPSAISGGAAAGGALGGMIGNATN